MKWKEPQYWRFLKVTHQNSDFHLQNFYRGQHDHDERRHHHRRREPGRGDQRPALPQPVAGLRRQRHEVPLQAHREHHRGEVPAALHVPRLAEAAVRDERGRVPAVDPQAGHGHEQQPGAGLQADRMDPRGQGERPDVLQQLRRRADGRHPGPERPGLRRRQAADDRELDRERQRVQRAAVRRRREALRRDRPDDLAPPHTARVRRLGLQQPEHGRAGVGERHRVCVQAGEALLHVARGEDHDRAPQPAAAQPQAGDRLARARAGRRRPARPRRSARAQRRAAASGGASSTRARCPSPSSVAVRRSRTSSRPTTSTRTRPASTAAPSASASSSGSIGLETTHSPLSASRPEKTETTTPGRSPSSGSARSSRRTSKPLMPGMRMSTRDRVEVLGRAARASASRAVVDDRRVDAVGLQPLGDQPRDLRLVVEHEHALAAPARDGRPVRSSSERGACGMRDRERRALAEHRGDVDRAADAGRRAT